MAQEREAVRGQKYNARRTHYRGVVYDSAAEAHRAAQLEFLVRAGRVVRWQRGERQTVLDDGRGNKVTYKPDFLVWTDEHHCHAEDVKGAVPRDFRIRAILFGLKFPHIPLRVVDKHGNVTWRLKDGKTKAKVARRQKGAGVLD